MRYYVEINGISSLTLTGFAIKELPPISKPPIRTQKDEIDGRDGDIITKLGYGAYDKQIEVGLYGNDYDINEIISFFNSEGIITFSNEPDKYYNFTIVNQIDFEKLLKFKTATITFHCQPFKYKKDEEPIEVEYDYVTGEGTEITLDNTDEAALKMELFGNTSQETTTGKNIFEVKEPDYKGQSAWNGYGDTTHYAMIDNGFTFSVRYCAIGWEFNNLIEGDEYVLSFDYVGNKTFWFDAGVNKYNGASEPNSSLTSLSANTTVKRGSFKFTAYSTNRIAFNSGYTSDITLTITNLQIEHNSTATPYEPYTGGNPSPNPQYPQDIQVVSGDNDIILDNKNLLDLKDYLKESNQGISFTYNEEEGSFSFSGTLELHTYLDFTNKERKFLPAGDYTISIDKPLNFRIVWYMTYEDGTTDEWGLFSPNTSRTITIPKNIISYNFAFTQMIIGENYNDTIKVQLEKGNIKTNFVKNETIKHSLLLAPNLFDINTITPNNYINATGTLTSSNYTNTSDYIEVVANEKYTICWDYNNLSNTATREIGFYDTNKSFINRTTGVNVINRKFSFISQQNGYIRFDYDKNCFNIYFYKNSDSLELCKIPNTNYIDGFEYDIDENKWYLHNEIKSYVLNGTQTIYSINTSSTNTTRVLWQRLIGDVITTTHQLLCNRLEMVQNWNTDVEGIYYETGSSGVGNIWLRINKSTIGTTDTEINTYLASNNIIIYYPLATSTNIEITYEPLIEQLNSLLGAMAKKGQTNISQINNDLPFYIKATTREQGSDIATIINEGNIFSKPILNVIGEGNVGVSLNGNQIFNLDLSDPNAITIDPNKLEAYNPNSLNLMNRKVIGDIANLKLPEGTNELKFDGALTKATITNYSRWL